MCAIFTDNWRVGGTGWGAYDFRARTAAQVPLTVIGASGQTANLIEAKNYAGTTVFSVDNSGNVVYLGDEYITDQLTVNGNAVVLGTTILTGATTISGAVSLSSTLDVAGITTLQDTTTQYLDVVRDLTLRNGYLRSASLSGLFIIPAGGTITTIGDAGTTSHSLAANDDLLITGKLEVDGLSYFDGAVEISSNSATFTHTGTTSLTIASTSGIVIVDGVTFNAGAVSGITTLSMAGDLTDYEATNDANPSWFLGSAAAERLEIQSVYDAGAQTLNYVQFQTYAASATADKGEYRFGVDGTDRLHIDDAGLESDSLASLTAVSLTLTGAMANAANAVGIILNTPAYTTAGAKLLSIQNNSVETAYIDYLGSFNAGAGTTLLPAYSFVGDPNTGINNPNADWLGFNIGGAQAMYLQGLTLTMATNGGYVGTYFQSHAGNPLQIQGRMADGANIAVKIMNLTAFTNTGAKIASFYPDAGTTEKAYVDLYGGYITLGGRIEERQGTDIASASTIVIPKDGNLFELTGTTAVNLITKTGFQDGFMITLVANENVTINHATATSGSDITILLAGAGNYAMTANDSLTLRLSTTTAGGQAWREVARTAI